jgi:hypothetical protein
MVLRICLTLGISGAHGPLRMRGTLGARPLHAVVRSLRPHLPHTDLSHSLSLPHRYSCERFVNVELLGPEPFNTRRFHPLELSSQIRVE